LIEYFEGCQGIIDDLAPDEKQGFQELYGNCQEVEQAAAAMLQDARPAMIFHVLVLNEAAAQQAQMFGGGSAPAPLVGPIGPLPPPSSPAGGAQIAQEFRRVCTTANLTVCVPQCNSLTYGFLLSIEIDGRGTVMTCNKMSLLFSWQGQASLGGYIGDDFQAFFSSVVSGAAGTYLTTLVEDAGISTDLSMQPGQNVQINGDPRLVEAPNWGSSAGFSVGEHASLVIMWISDLGRMEVRAKGHLELTRSIVADLRETHLGDSGGRNLHQVEFDGGAIWVGGMLIADGCTFSQNTGYHGGAIFVAVGGSAMISNTNFNNNRVVAGDVNQNGGAIFMCGGSTVEVSGSTFVGNRREDMNDYGAAIWVGDCRDDSESSWQSDCLGVQGPASITLSNSHFASGTPVALYFAARHHSPPRYSNSELNAAQPLHA
jgi:hypothetical protein